jgi:hypothetical protein
MTKIWIVKLINWFIFMVYFYGFFSGCAVKNLKTEKVNKEMIKSKKSKEEQALDKSQAQNNSSGIETPSIIVEETIDEKSVFNSSNQTQPLTN